MTTKEEINKRIDNLDKNFDDLITSNNLNVSSIENLALNSTEEIKQIINKHVETLIVQKLDEKELIIKKNKNGKTKGLT